MKNPLVSVIVPVHNSGKYLDRSITAIMTQTYTNWELFLVDDGSSDDSLKRIYDFCKSDSRIKFIHFDSSRGAGPARNAGLEHSSGEYIIFLDADDYAEPNMLKRLVEKIQQGYDLVICNYNSYVEGTNLKTASEISPANYLSKKETQTLFLGEFPKGSVGYLWNKVYKASIIKEHKIEFPSMRRLQDGVFNIHYFSCINSCAIIDDVLYNYRINRQTDMFKKCPRDYFELIKDFTNEYLAFCKKCCVEPGMEIRRFFLNEVGTCIENCFSDEWDFSYEQRKEYLNMISCDDIFKRFKTDIGLVGAYRRFLIKNCGHMFILKSLVSLKIFFKIYLKKFFYKVKGKI